MGGEAQRCQEGTRAHERTLLAVAAFPRTLCRFLAPATPAVTYNKCTYTNITAIGDAWVTVDLGASSSIDVITFISRTDYVARNGGFRIFVNNVAVYNRTNAAFAAAAACPNPYADNLGKVSLPVTGTACQRGRYIHVVLPYTTSSRVLHVCELQAWRKSTWRWRFVSAVANVALGKQTAQSTTALYYNGGDSARAVDGLNGGGDYNVIPYTCTYTAGSPTDATKLNWWLVDLGAVYDIRYLNIYPRRDCCSYRNTRWQLFIGNGRDYNSAINTQCTLPADVTPTVGTFITANCKASGRYVIINRVFAMNDTGNNVLTICELQAYAPLQTNMPTARMFHAATTFRGSLFVFGGQDAAGVYLNDMRVYDFTTASWKEASVSTPLNTPPAARINALLFPLDSRRLVLFGGMGTSDVLGDMWTLEFTPCAAYNVRQTTVARSLMAGTSQYLSCTGGFNASMSADTPAHCLPDGTWTGSQPYCVGTAPSPPRSVVAVVDSSTRGTARVSWTAPASWGSSQDVTARSYTVQPVDGSYMQRFQSVAFPPDWLTDWTWTNPGGNSYFSFSDDGLNMNLAGNEDCPTAPPFNCPRLIKNWPQGVSTTDWAIETKMTMPDNGLLQPVSALCRNCARRPVAPYPFRSSSPCRCYRHDAHCRATASAVSRCTTAQAFRRSSSASSSRRRLTILRSASAPPRALSGRGVSAAAAGGRDRRAAPKRNGPSSSARPYAAMCTLQTP